MPLVDFAEHGAGARASWLELYAPSVPAPTHAPAGGAHALASAYGVLHALTLAAGASPRARLRIWNGRAAMLPDETTGLELDEAGNRQRVETAELEAITKLAPVPTAPLCVGLRLQLDPLLEGLGEALDAWSDRKLCTVTLEAPGGAGLTTLLSLVASEARRRGFVPVCPSTAPLVETLPELRERALVLIVDASTTPGIPWPTLHGVGASSRALRHPPMFPGPLVARWARAGRAVALVVGVWRSLPTQRTFRLAGWCGRELVGAVAWPARAVPGEVRSVVERAAHAAAGAPGLFIDALRAAGYWCGSQTMETYASARRQPLLAAEEACEYAPAQGPPATAARAADAAALPKGASAPLAAGDRLLVRARAEIERARTLSARGRRAQAVALLRVTLGTLRRRGAAIEAAEAAMALGEALLRQGHTERAAAHFRQAADLFAGARCLDRANDATRAMGAAETDAGRFDVAERLLRAAELDALGRSDNRRCARARVELMRCTFWQSRFADVEELAGALSTAGGPRPTRALVYEALALIAQQRIVQAGQVLRGTTGVGRPFGEEAAQHGSGRVGESAAQCDRSGLTQALRLEAIEWHAAHAVLQARVSNRDAAFEHVRAALAAARAAALPLAALTCRAVALRVAGALDARSETRHMAQRLARARRLQLPPLVRACIDHALASHGPAHAACGESRRRAWGERAGVHAAAAPRRSSILLAVGRVLDALFEGSHEERAMTAALSDVLRVCQDARDEAMGLEAICRSLRRELDASAVFIVGREPPTGTMVGVGRAGRAALDTCRSTLDAGLPNGLATTASGLVGAVPVRTHGVTIAALGACWSLGATPDGRRVLALLASAAAASASLVWLLVDRHTRLPAAEETGIRSGLLGVGRAMAELRHAVARAAAAPFPVLIEGESGSGKELIARGIHAASARRLRRFCPLNCAALPDDLLDAELFGHTRGAFTGALTDRAGLFEEADDGTLFLDEIGELSPRGQAKLLRTIQEGEVRRIGETLPRRVDVRIVAASNRSLQSTADEGRFRRDLLYRLDVVHIVAPPLRERPEDIAVLATHYWNQATQRVGSAARLSPATVAALARYDWPGNVRELQNVLAALAVRAPSRGQVGPRLLPDALAAQSGAARAATLEEARRAFETRYVRAALARTAGCRARAARELGLTRQGLQKLMARLGIV